MDSWLEKRWRDTLSTESEKVSDTSEQCAHKLQGIFSFSTDACFPRRVVRVSTNFQVSELPHRVFRVVLLVGIETNARYFTPRYHERACMHLKWTEHKHPAHVRAVGKAPPRLDPGVSPWATLANLFRSPVSPFIENIRARALLSCEFRHEFRWLSLGLATFQGRVCSFTRFLKPA